MITKFDKSSFQIMPWKNGGGSTLELFKISANESDFLFRLSIATVGSNGPFSIFPGIERILLLLEGNGFKLNKKSQEIILDKTESPLYFQGEEEITCELLQGSCRDFNVMTRRDYATSSISFLKGNKEDSINIKASCPLKFIYDTHAEILYKMERGDELELKTSPDSLLFVIDVNLL